MCDVTGPLRSPVPRRDGVSGPCVAAAQVVVVVMVVVSYGRARVCVSRSGARKSVGELAAVFCEQRASCAAVGSRLRWWKSEVVRLAVLKRRSEFIASPLVVEIAASCTRGWTRARARVEYTRKRVASSVFRALRHGLNVFSRV